MHIHVCLNIYQHTNILSNHQRLSFFSEKLKKGRRSKFNFNKRISKLVFIDISAKNNSEKELSEKDELEKCKLKNEKMNTQMTADKKIKKFDVGDDSKNIFTDRHDSFKLELFSIQQEEIAPFSLNEVVDGLFILSNGTQRWYPGKIFYIRIYVYTYIYACL